MAIGIAAAGLALGVGLETGHFGFRLGAEKTLGPEEAANYALRYLMRVPVTKRLDRQRRLNDAQARNQVAIDTELARVREHSLYAWTNDGT